MSIEFAQPLYLLLIPPLVYLTWRLAKNSLADMSGFRSKFSMGLRIAIILLLVLALAGARSITDVNRHCVVFVLDVSDSISKAKQKSALDYVNKSLSGIKSDEKVGMVVFGSDALIEQVPGIGMKLDKIHSVPRTNQSDISQALALALAVFPDRTAKKIVLITDGNETRGKVLEQASLVGAAGVSVDVVPIEVDNSRETLLDKMLVPGMVKAGEPFDIKVVAQSTQPVAASVRVIRNGVPVETKSVQLVKGKSILTFRQSIPKAGSYEFEALLDSTVDTRTENNKAVGFTQVKGKPRVLYVEGVPQQAGYLRKALASREMIVDQVDMHGIPKTLPEYRAYDMLVFSDIPAWSMNPEQMSMIRSSVRDLGVGFTMIGGENSFGAGGYFDTPIEETLPVDMSVKKTKILPSAAVVVVMDKSGSMGAPEGGRTKIELANDAAASVVKLLQPVDYVSVVVCHDYPVVAVKLTPAQNKERIYSEISTIRAEGGGITVFPSMNAAYGVIKPAPTRLKHIILLADGSDCDEQDGTVALVQQMAAKKITVTTVAIGDGPHVPFLKAVAYAGKGGFYLAKRAGDLKAIFTKDVMQVSKSVLVEEPFAPKMDPNSPELSGIDPGTVPVLLGYVATSPKPAASVSMLTNKDDPLLATWQFGLGRSAAFTSDCKARWSSHWLSWAGYGKFWTQVLRSTMRKSGSSDFQSMVDIVNGVGYVTIDAVDAKGEFVNSMKFKGSLVRPDMKSSQLNIHQTGPGRYEADFTADDTGSYVVSVVRSDQKATAPDTSVVSIPYPQEYKCLNPDNSILKRIAETTGGSISPDPKRIFGGGFRPTKDYSDLWRLFTLLSIVLLPIDIAVRRLAVNYPEFINLMSTVLSKLTSNRVKPVRLPEAKPEETASALLAAKKERKVSETKEQFEPQAVQVESKKAPKLQVSEPQEDMTSRLLAVKRRAGKTKPDGEEGK